MNCLTKSGVFFSTNKTFHRIIINAIVQSEPLHMTHLHQIYRYNRRDVRAVK
jgi:hypothetical protein